MDAMIDIAPGVKTGLLEYQLILIDVSELSVEQFKGHPVLQVLLELLQLASKNRLVREFDRIISRLLALKNDPRMKGWLKSFARYAMSVAKIGIEQIIQAFSKILNEKEAYNMAMTTAEELMVKGEVRGKIQGKIEGKKETILGVLEVRFGKVPKAISNTVNSYSDLTALQSLSVFAKTCASLDEFKDSFR
jgi:hypothetical protein